LKIAFHVCFIKQMPWVLEDGTLKLKGETNALTDITRDNLRTFLRIAKSKFAKAGFDVKDGGPPTGAKDSMVVTLLTVEGLELKFGAVLFRGPVFAPFLALEASDDGTDTNLTTAVAAIVLDSIRATIHNFKTRETFYGEEAVAELFKPSRMAKRLELNDETAFTEYEAYPTRGPNAGRKRTTKTKT
jgi:hypothetical protein